MGKATNATKKAQYLFGDLLSSDVGPANLILVLDDPLMIELTFLLNLLLKSKVI